MTVLKSNLPAIKAAIEKLFQDPELRRNVVYYRFNSEAFDVVLGHNVTVYDELEITGAQFKSTAQTAAVQTGSLQIGEPVFLFRPGDLGIEISTKDQIIDADGSIFKVKEIVSLHGIATEIIVEGGGLQEKEK